MRRLIVAIDCDDVLISTAPAIIANYRQRFNTDLKLEDFYSRDPKKWGVDSIELASQRVGEYLASEAHQQILPDVEAIEAVKRIANNHELHLVTGRSNDLGDITMKMIEQYFTGCFKSVELTNHFNQSQKRTKGDVCRLLNADILIDDHLEHISSVLDSGLREVIVFGDYPWNQTRRLPEGAIRCDNWQAVEQEIERIASQ